MYSDSIELLFQTYLEKGEEYAKDPRPILLLYSTKGTFMNYAKYFGIMDDFKDGVPRTGYMGIVTVYAHGKRIYIAPHVKEAWKGYDPSW